MAATVKGQLPNTDILRKLNIELLRNILENVPGTKDLFIDPQLMKPLDRLANISFLKSHGVDKIFKLDTAKSVGGNSVRFYLIKPEVKIVRIICEQIKSEQNRGVKRTYRIVMVPRNLYICEKIFEEEGIHGSVELVNFPLYMLPLDSDIITMELDNFHSSYFWRKDETLIHTASSALVDIQRVFGKIPSIYSIGECSKKVWDLSETLLSYNCDDISKVQSEIGQMILIDRDVDYVTPMCSPVTYEGLLDDTFGVRCGVVEIPPEDSGNDKPTKMILNSRDEFFEEIRNRHFATVSKYIYSKAMSLRDAKEKAKSLSISEMKEFVQNELQKLNKDGQTIAQHMTACATITKSKTLGGNLEEMLITEHGLLEGHSMTDNLQFIQNCMYQEMDKLMVLRLLCLYSLVKDGLQPDVYENLKTEYLQSYGYEQLLTFHTLNKLGLFTQKEQAPSTTVKIGGSGGSSLKINTSKLSLPRKSSFQIISKNLKLISKESQEMDLHNPRDMSYVFSGAYTPLSCRIIELVLEKRGFSGFEESIKLITSSYHSQAAKQSARGGKSAPSSLEQTVLLVFVGGVTYSEIAALRFLGYLKGFKFLILTTDIITGGRLLKRLSQI